MEKKRIMIGSIPAVTLLRECYASFIFYHGFAFITFTLAFPTTLIPQLKENGFDIDTFTESCLGSTSAFFTGLCSFFIPFLHGKAGRKRVLQASLFFCAIGMIIVASSAQVSTIFCGLIIASLASSSLAPVLSCYISEICEKKRRGVLLSSMHLTGTMAATSVYVMHAFLSWRMIAAFWAALCCSGLVQAFAVPESKYYHMLRGDEEKARESAEWFQPYLNDTEIGRMLDEIRRSIVATDKNTSSNLFGRFFKNVRRRAVKRPLLKGILAHFLRIGMGRAILSVYFVQVLRNLEISYDFKVITAWYGIVGVIGSIIVLGFIHKLKRKTAIYVSCLIIITSLSTIIAYKISLSAGIAAPGWIAVAGLYSYTMVATCGYTSVISVIVSEVQVAEFRVEANAIVGGCVNIFFGMYSFIYPFAQAVMPIEYILCYCVASVALSALSIHVMFPETSNFEFYQNKDEKKTVTANVS